MSNSMASIPPPSPSTTNLSSTIDDVYEQFVRQCDSLNGRTPNWYYSAYAFLLIYTVGILLQLCILPTNRRLAKHRSAFLLLLYINILDVLWLLQYIWLCVEFILGGKHLALPLALDAYLFRIVNFCIDAIYIELALSRCMAVLDDRGKLFEMLFSQKNNKIYLLCTVIVGILYSIYTNLFPVRRVFHCLVELSVFEPTTNIPKVLLDKLPDTWLYDAIQHIYMVAIFIPVLMYIAAFAKLFFKYAKRKLAKNSASIEPVLSSLQPAPTNSGGAFTLSATLPIPPINAAHFLGLKTHPQFANFALERSRLFLLCFFSQLPYLLANGFHLYRTEQIDPTTMHTLAYFWQTFGTIFHVQQPILMLLLSKDMRRGVKEDFFRLIRGYRTYMHF